MRRTFLAVLALTVLAEVLVEQRRHFDVEAFLGIYALFGFIACAALILVARAIGAVLKRPDGYYDEHG